MSKDRQETIEDIVAWIRRPREGENAYLTLWRDEIADRIEAAEKQSVTNCNRFGNAAKMREACDNISEYAKAAACHTEDAHLLGYLNQIEIWAEDALAEPPRNCDVGTAEEQSKRHREWCRQARCVFGCIQCIAEWLQLPYVRELQTTCEVVK